jgi:hypothetical protein
MHADARKSEIVYNPPPLDLRALKIDKKRKTKVGGFEVIDALGNVFIGEMLRAL